jgi:hypothetical protein
MSLFAVQTRELAFTSSVRMVKNTGFLPVRLQGNRRGIPSYETDVEFSSHLKDDVRLYQAVTDEFNGLFLVRDVILVRQSRRSIFYIEG